MPFEIMLTQIVNLPVKYFIVIHKSEDEERTAIEKFDRQMTKLKLPAMLLERLKKEFDQNYKISVRAQGSSDKWLKTHIYIYD